VTEPIVRPPSFVRRHLATNVDAGDTLVGLACDDNLWVRREAAENLATPRWVLDLLVRAGADHDLRGRGRPDPGMPEADLRRLVECGPWARQLVAEHPNASAEILDVLATQPSARLRRAVVRHPHLAPSTAARMCADGNETIRSRAAAHPACPANVLTAMHDAGADEMLSGVAATRPERPGADELRRVAALGPWGRFLAARAATCPTELVEGAAADPDWTIRSGVLDNPETPDELVRRVAGDEAGAGVTRLRTLSDADATGDDLASLADHVQPEVRLAVARHAGADADTIARLAVDRVPEIRRCAVAHQRIDPALHSLLVRAGSTDDLGRLAPPDPSITAGELDDLSRGGYWARQLAVRHPDTASETLARLLCDTDPKLREWAAAHPGVPRDAVDVLLRAGAATDFQGIAPPGDPQMSRTELRRVAALGPYGELVVSWHPNSPAHLRTT
jgi:hypothetical protein